MACRSRAWTIRRLGGAALMMVIAAGIGQARAQVAVTPGPTPADDVATLPATAVEEALEGLPDLIAQAMERTGLPGLAVAVVHEGEIVFSGGWGTRRAGADAPVTPDTPFQVASLSKPVSASVVAAAIGAGHVRWDDPVVAHLPGFRLSDPWVTAHVTIGDMFAHRSGLPATAGDELEDLGFDRATIIARLAQMPLDSFRISYHYANFGLTIGAEAVAAAAGRDFEDLAEALVFAPLAMDRTSFRHADLLAAPDRAILHTHETGSFEALHERDADAQAPAGGLSSTAHDLARWMIMILAGGAGPEGEILQAGDLLPALSPQAPSGPPSAAGLRPGQYGYGFNVGVSGTGRVVLGHSGAFLLGAATNLQLMPGEDLGIVVLSNGGPIGVVEAISQGFLDLVQYGAPSRDWVAAYGGAFAPMHALIGDLVGGEAGPDRPGPADLADFAGRYDNPYFGPVTLAEEGDGLVLTFVETDSRFPLEPWSRDVLAIRPRSENAPIGSVSSLRILREGGRVSGLVIDHLDTNGLGRWAR